MPIWITFALLSTFFAGLTSVLAKIGLQETGPHYGLWLRTFIVFMAVSIHFVSMQSLYNLPPISMKAAGFLVASGLTTSFSWIFYYQAMHIGHVGTIASIDKGSVIITLILTVTVLGEELSPKVLIGAGLILAGMAVLVWGN